MNLKFEVKNNTKPTVPTILQKKIIVCVEGMSSR